ncbi:hypothetical protein J010_02058 [Cryptococcus neoformans]|nr:hypothetical protein C355_01958 [Cryptococcus neoformans var. grubii Th84]OXG84321.1 hypothetical protein C350_02070 [Cryptococcus neoformans var. grubii MW-RSA36]OXH14341.1 hypothetical protein J010_02058 [Cryptococcus neoformans var. grubii]OXL09523.1 hypothetical protein C348_02269 [Cryptococcus neoformans var. grubii Gb118]OXH34944.1 hypothetical protein J009_02085 [Cryptococcus neoformans var. grubii]
MSVDLSHPDIAAACASISNPADPAAWLLLQYASPPSTTQLPQLLLLDSGPLPVLPAWQHHLQTTHQSILFGYAEIAEKGLVLVYLTPDVGGVKRARAIVHSRAFASLFPDYSAIITISHPSELTEQLIADELALNLPSTTSLPVSVPAASTQYVVPGADVLVPDPLSPRGAGMGRDLPSLPFPTSNQQSLQTTQLQTSQLPPLPPLPPSPIPPSPVSKDETGISRVSNVNGMNEAKEVEKGMNLEEGGEHEREGRQENDHGSGFENGNGNRNGNMSTNITTSTRKPVPALSLSPSPPRPPRHSQPRTPPKPQPILLPNSAHLPVAPLDLAPAPATPAQATGGTEERSRKSSTPLSLTSRLKNTFHRSSLKDKDSPTVVPSSPTPTPSSPSFPSSANNAKPDDLGSPISNPNATSTPHSPSTPSAGKFKASSLSKVFGKRKSAGTSTSTPSGSGTWAGPGEGSKLTEEREGQRINEFGRPPQTGEGLQVSSQSTGIDPPVAPASVPIASPSLAAAPTPSPKSPLPHPSEPSVQSGPTDELNSPPAGLEPGLGLATPLPPRGSSLQPHHSPSPLSSPGAPGAQERQTIGTGNAVFPLAGVPLLGPEAPLPLLPPSSPSSHSHRGLDSNLERVGSPYYTPSLMHPSPSFQPQEGKTQNQPYTYPSRLHPHTQTPSHSHPSAAATTMQSPPSRSTSLSSSAPPTTTLATTTMGPAYIPAGTQDAYANAKEGGEEIEAEEGKQRDREREREKERESVLLAYDRPEIESKLDPRQEEGTTEIMEGMEKGLFPHQGEQVSDASAPNPVSLGAPAPAPVDEYDSLSHPSALQSPSPLHPTTPIHATAPHLVEGQTEEAEKETKETPVQTKEAKAEGEDDEQNQKEGEEQRLEREREREMLEAQQLAQWQAAETARWEAEESARLEREQAVRLAAEEQARRDAEEAERFRLEEEERVRAEEEARRQKKAEEEARRRAEEERRRQREREEEENRRVEEEERRKREEERRKEEEERRKREEEEERERKRKEEAEERKRTVRDGLERGKREGGLMLKGSVTVQTCKSLTWRRRYFQLFSHEMQLFKNENDTKPIQIIPLSKSTDISETYEESQVKDSFKISSGDEGEGGEVFFLFTDSAEDKEFVLDGVRLCIG